MAKGKSIAIAGLVVIIIGAGLYFAGLWAGRNQVEEKRAELARNLQQIQGNLTSAQNLNNLLRARVDLCKTLEQLDQRNFGIANTYLHSAGADLASVNANALGVDAVRLEGLRREIAGTNIQVVANLEEQRKNIYDFVFRLESLMPNQPPRILPDLR